MSKVLRSHEVKDKRPWLPQPLHLPETPIDDTPVDPQAMLEELRAQAQTEADQILSHAHEQAEVLRQQAYQEGYAKGENEGRAKAESAYNDKIAELTAVIDGVNTERDEAFSRVEADLVRLSTTIAEKLITQQLTIQPDIIVNMVRTHMKYIREREVVRVRVNPEDLPILMEAKPSLLADVDGVRDIQLYDDRRIGRGSMVIEAESGSLDARLPSQIEIVTKALDEALEVPHDAQDD
ncbi:MAG TPA: FliH/SctL family protein [Armatimonadota bacterium]|nr:FliH/SctL family protein [Armatimonadota bacterium]